MKNSEYRLKGHESFVLREGWLTKGLAAVHQDSKLFRKENNYGADALGVGTNMAKSIRYWLRAMGLTEESQKSGTVLTRFGKLIYKYDPYIEDVFTLWLVHINLICNFKLATSWNVFFNSIDVNSFTPDELYEMMEVKLEEVIGDDSLPARSIRDDCAAIRAMYVETQEADTDPEDKKTSPFSVLGLLWSNGKYFGKQSPVVSKLDSMIILYILSDRLIDGESLKIDEVISGENMPGKLLNLNRIVANDYLDILQNQGYITVNRTAGLNMIYPIKDSIPTKLDIIKNHYERSGAL